MSKTEPFQVYLRRESNFETTVTVRFELTEGMGVLGLRVGGRTDPPPSVHSEESNIEADDLRAGRFVHVLSGGRRQSYALSRVTADVIEHLSEGSWIELEAVTEYGFRYLVPPKPNEVEAYASVKMEPLSVTAAETKNFGAAVAHMRAPRPKGVALASETGAPSTPTAASRPAPTAGDGHHQQVSVAPALAESMLAGLSGADAIAALKTEMQRVADLHKKVLELERRLEESKAREADLLGVLGSWQSRG